MGIQRPGSGVDHSPTPYAYLPFPWGQDWAGASQAFQAAADLEPDIPTLEVRAQARERGGHLSQAIAVYRQILQRQPAFQVPLKLGLLLEKTGDYQAAVSHLEQAAAGAGPSGFSAFKELGFLDYRLEHFAEAQRSRERALALQPHDPELYQALAEKALKLKAPDQGRAYQKKALEFSRPEAVARRQEKLGVMAPQLGRAQEAADYFQPAQAAGRDSWEMNSRALSTRMRSGSPYWAIARFRAETTSSMTNWKRFSRLAVPAARPSEPATTRINK